MQQVRLVYFSENAIDTSRGTMISQINEIRSIARRRNEKTGLTGALIFDQNWFVQVLEGDIREVMALYARILEDPRHRNVTFLEMKAAETRIFGNWWMACFELTRDTATISAPYLHDGKFQPIQMGTDKILALAADFATIGYDRQMVA